MSFGVSLPPQKPTAALILSIVAGVFVLVGGLILWIGSSFSTGLVGEAVAVLGIMGVIMGLIMTFGSMTMYSRPKWYAKWGIIILIFAFLSWLTTLGGLLIGFILGLIGGILWIVWKPRAHQLSAQSTPPQQPTAQIPPLIPTDQECPYCGNPVLKSDLYCPRCGKELDSPIF